MKKESKFSAIDIWASGVMMLCILSSTQPFFRSPDDCTALAEITSMFGTCKMQQCAQKLGTLKALQLRRMICLYFKSFVFYYTYILNLFYIFFICIFLTQVKKLFLAIIYQALTLCPCVKSYRKEIEAWHMIGIVHARYILFVF